MPKVKTTLPEPTREKGQRSLDLPLYLDRVINQIFQPQWLEADMWRKIVANQPFATIFRDTLIANYLALDWKIEPRDSEKRDEYKTEIDYYTHFFEYTGDYDYAEIVEWIGKDMLDLPFGGAAEVGRENDDPGGKVLWLELLDGGTLFPTLNADFPVGQKIPDVALKQVFFPYYAIDRVYLAPRTEIRRKGWGMPPPEKIYLAIEMLRRGDVYYAALLLDTPDAGILDLIDMEKSSAEAWVDSWKNLLTGIDPFKIPVLYEHEKAAVWIPFTRPPGDIMFDSAIMKYVGIVAAGYGMSPSDVGFSPVSSGGETLAGSIRAERKTKKTGLTKAKRKFTTFFNFLLPSYLKFTLIDLDDEVSVALGRARLATSTALQILVDKKILVPNEARQQMLADGLLTISIPENIEGGDQVSQAPNPALGGGANSPERPGMLGRPVSPSQGGYGEIKAELYEEFSDVISESTFKEEAPMTELSDTDMELAKAFVLVAKAILGKKEQPINVFVPRTEQVAPIVNVAVPKQSPPIVNVAVPTQVVPAPTINVSIPEQKPPVVNIKSHTKSIGKQRVKRDPDGNLTETITETEYKYDG